MSISSLHFSLVRCCYLIRMPAQVANGDGKCYALLSARFSTYKFNENCSIQLIQPEIWSRYQGLSSKKTPRKNGRFRDHSRLLRFRYVCLIAPTVDCGNILTYILDIFLAGHCLVDELGQVFNSSDSFFRHISSSIIVMRGVSMAGGTGDSVLAYRITSSAWKRRGGGMVRLRAWAVLRLITSSNFMGCSIGRSVGLAPLRILAT